MGQKSTTGKKMGYDVFENQTEYDRTQENLGKIN
jgi:hypothetical protein